MATRNLSPLRRRIVFAAVVLAATGCSPDSRPAEAAADSPPPKNAITGERLRQVLARTHEGKQDALEWFEGALERKEGVAFAKDALPVLVEMLNDEIPRCQLAGARGLYQVQDPDSKDALVAFLESKDFKELERRAYAMEMDDDDYEQQMMAASFAVLTLGKVGDKSVVPLLESLRDVKDIKFEWSGSPVPQALRDLGATEALLNVPKDASFERIWDGVEAMKSIRDPQKVPELLALVADPNAIEEMRGAAVVALAGIDTPEMPDRIAHIMADTALPREVRRCAVMSAAQNRMRDAEPTLLGMREERDPELRAAVLMGLILLNPRTYLAQWFQDIMDVKQNLEYREHLSGWAGYLSKEQFVEHKQDLYACLNAMTNDGLPADLIRTNIWLTINEQFGEEPVVVLTSRRAGRAESIRSRLDSRIEKRPPWEQREQQLKAAFERLVMVYDPDTRGGNVP